MTLTNTIVAGNTPTARPDVSATVTQGRQPDRRREQLRLVGPT